MSNFVLAAAKDRADEVVRHHTHTVVPAEFFDSLIAALDQPIEANEALVRAVRRSHSRADQL